MPPRKTIPHLPASTTRHPSPAPTTNHKPRKLEQDSGTRRRAGSAGGVRLTSQSPARIRMGTPTRTTPTAKDATTAAQAKEGPNRQRRRPRKLNKEPTQSQNIPNTPAQGGEAPTASTAELEALKSRVRGLEAKVEELYKVGEARGGRSPRRRGKGRKDSTKDVPTTTTAKDEPAPVAIQEEEEADEELVRLEGELESARQDLASYSLTPHKSRRKKSGIVEEDNIEDIPRDSPSVEDMHNTGDRQVTLTGSYRIPLPSSVSMEDVKSIQSGINSASNVAKSFMDQRRAQQTVRDPTQPSSSSSSRLQRAQRTQRTSQSTAVSSNSAAEKQSWSEWIGGYSMAITRAVKNIETEAAIESQHTTATRGPKRPAQGARTASAPSTRPTPSTKPASAAKTPKASTGTSTKKGTTAGQRPPLKPTTNNKANLSSEQVHGLMS